MSDKIEQLTKEAQHTASAAFKEAAAKAESERMVAHQAAVEAECESARLAALAKQKSHEADSYKAEAKALESQKKNLEARAFVEDGNAPGYMDRVRAGLTTAGTKTSETAHVVAHDVGDSVTHAAQVIGKKAEELGASAQIKFNEGMIAVTEKMSSKSEDMALKAKLSAEEARIAAERDREQVKLVESKTFTQPIVRTEVTTSTTDPSWTLRMKETVMSKAENAAEATADKAKSAEQYYGEKRAEAQIEQGKIPMKH